MGGWCWRSYLGSAEIVSCVFLVLFKDGQRKASPKCHLYVFDVNQRKRRVESKIFMRGPKNGKMFLRSSASY